MDDGDGDGDGDGGDSLVFGVKQSAGSPSVYTDALLQLNSESE
jgi:hypothetical protein